MKAAKAAKETSEVWGLLTYEYELAKVDPAFAAQFGEHQMGHLNGLHRVGSFVSWYQMKHQDGWHQPGLADDAAYALMIKWVDGLISVDDDEASLAYLADCMHVIAG